MLHWHATYPQGECDAEHDRRELQGQLLDVSPRHARAYSEGGNSTMGAAHPFDWLKPLPHDPLRP